MLSKPVNKSRKVKHKKVDGHPCNGAEGEVCDIKHGVSILGGQFVVSKCETCLVTFNREGFIAKKKEKKESKKKSKRKKKPKKVKPDNLFTGYEGSL